MEKPQTNNNGTKSKLPLLVIILSVLLLGSSGTLTYLYITEKSSNDTLKSDYEALQTEYNTKTEDILALQEDITTYEGKISKVTSYNSVDKYIYDTIVKHNGFSGWTQTEYNTVKGMADDIEDTELSASLHSAWYDRNGLPLTRFTRVMLAIINGITDSTK
ncbi:MAG: hypothetical protein PHE21_00585 [Candidatus Dojkabacteria bacterium]|nr:hypothetical protein [Candidatus Dojkabacteria bacterium]